MKSQIVLTILSTSLAVCTHSSFSHTTPANFHLQAIPVGATSGSYLGVLYEPSPHNYGILYNGSGSRLQPPAPFSFNTTGNRLVYNLTGRGTYESVTPSNFSVNLFPNGGDLDPSGQLGSARDSSGALYLLNLAYSRPSAFDQWYLCYNFTESAGVTYLAAGTLRLGDPVGETCNKATVRIEELA